MSHFTLSLFLAVLISVALGLLGGRSRRECVYSAVRVFVGCFVTTVAGAWFMHFLNG